MADSRKENPYVHSEDRCNGCEYGGGSGHLCQFCDNRKGVLQENVLLRTDLPESTFNKFANEVVDCLNDSGGNLSKKQIEELQLDFYPSMVKKTSFCDKIRKCIINLFK